MAAARTAPAVDSGGNVRRRSASVVRVRGRELATELAEGAVVRVVLQDRGAAQELVDARLRLQLQQGVHDFVRQGARHFVAEAVADAVQHPIGLALGEWQGSGA